MFNCVRRFLHNLDSTIKEKTLITFFQNAIRFIVIRRYSVELSKTKFQKSY